MKTYITRWSQVFIAGVGILIATFGLISWGGGLGNKQQQAGQKRDTIPAKEKTPYAKDFDKELRKLDYAKQQLDELKSKDWSNVQDDLERAMKNFYVEKIQSQAQQAIDKVDIEKMAKELEASLDKIDFNKIQRDIDAAGENLSKIDQEKLKQELQNDVSVQLKREDWHKELEKVRNIDLEEINIAVEEAKKEIAKIEAELKAEKIDIKETLASAYADIDNARQDLKEYQEMVYRLEEQGLLNTTEDYTLEYKEGQLYINGEKQSKEVTNKYKKYFRKETVTIKKRNGNIKLDAD